MAEIEFKLQIPAHRLEAVRVAMHRGRCATARFRALYFDTSDHQLMHAGFVLRLRREGPRWVQAIKGSGDGMLSRLEHEVALGVGGAPPVPDLARHGGSAEFEALQAAVGKPLGTLAPLFEVNVVRSSRLLRHEGATIEAALDEGFIVAGAARAPVHELELELKSGPLQSLAGLAGRWAARHELWVDVRAKSQRGYQLACGANALPAARGAPPVLRVHADADTALRACVAAALAQLLPNAAALAADDGAAEHVHQTRIALRRLLSLLREFGAWSTEVDPQWTVQAARLFKQLGPARDRDALKGWVVPQLQSAGAPLSMPDGQSVASPAAALLRSAETSALLIALLVFAQAASQAPAVGDAVLDRARPLLLRLHRRLQRAGKRFARLDDDARHRARKQLKRLRYCAESLSSLFPSKAWAAYAARLKVAQDALGRLQDTMVADTAFRGALESDPRAWFALGWLAGQRPVLMAEAGAALAALGKAPRFLR